MIAWTPERKRTLRITGIVLFVVLAFLGWGAWYKLFRVVPQPPFDSGDERYFDRLDQQVDRLLASTDAAANGIGMMLDLQLNERAYLVSVLATIFVPLTDGTQRASGAAWAPGALPAPSTLAVGLMAGGALLRRRR